MSTNIFNLSNIRREYKLGKLRRSDLTKNPMQLFYKWLKEACSAKIPDPTAMCLATVDHEGQPFQRLVLLKFFTDKKIIFFTNFQSRKAMHLLTNPKISVCFPWNIIDRQVIITGKANKLPKIKTIQYFYDRPKSNQIGIWASKQSETIKSRRILENKFSRFNKKYSHKPIPFPTFWGGYQVNINSIEFWQGRSHRLHDRFIYKKHQNQWYINRLSP